MDHDPDFHTIQQRGFLLVQMVLRTWNEDKEIDNTCLSFELFC